MATSVIAVVLKFSKNKNRTIATRIEPSRKASMMLWIAFLIKSACLKISGLRIIPSGNDFSIETSSFSMRSVKPIVSVPGCFETASNTPALPLTDASPRFAIGPASLTSATSASVRAGISGETSFAMTVFSRSSRDLIRPKLRTECS